MEVEKMNITSAERQNRKPRLSPELAEVLKMLKSLEAQGQNGPNSKDV